MSFLTRLPEYLWQTAVPILLMFLFIVVLFVFLLDKILLLLIKMPKTYRTVFTLFVLLVTTKIGFYLFISIPLCFNYNGLQNIINTNYIDKVFLIAEISLIGIYILGDLKKSIETVIFDKPFNFKRFYGFWLSLTGLVLFIGIVNQSFFSKFLYELISMRNSVVISITMIVYYWACYVFFTHKNLELLLGIEIPSIDWSSLLKVHNDKKE